MFRTTNPALNNEAFAPSDWQGLQSDRTTGRIAAPANVMTLRGTIVKSGVLLVLALATAAATWTGIQSGTLPTTTPVIGFFVSLVVGVVLAFAPKASAFLSPIYAVAEGALLGGISFMFAARLGAEGTAMIGQAIGLTFGIFAALLITFSMGWVRMGGTMLKIVTVATTGVCLVYLVNLVLRLTGIGSVPFIHDSSPLGIAFSMFVVVLASLNLVRDFQRIEVGIQNGAPKYMEWYSGYALLVTLVWLYLEILRLLSKLKSRD